MISFWSRSGQLARHAPAPLDDEHHVRPARVVFVEDDGDGVAAALQGQDALVELGHLLAVAQLDRILADQGRSG